MSERLTSFRNTEFSHRSEVPLLMDSFELSYTEYARSIQKIENLTKCIGGDSLAYKSLLPLMRKVCSYQKSIRVLAFSTGSLKNAIQLVQWARKHQVKIHIESIVLNEHAARFARNQGRRYPEISVIQGDPLSLSYGDNAFDFAMASMFLQHLHTAEILAFLRKLQRIVRYGWYMDELERTPSLYYLLKGTTVLLNSPVPIKYDMPLSVLRAFTTREARSLRGMTGILGLKVVKRAPFRLGIVGVKSIPDVRESTPAGSHLQSEQYRLPQSTLPFGPR